LDFHPNCFPLRTPKDRLFTTGCTNLFVRSGQFCRRSGSDREQANKVTAFVDASSVYGSDEATNKKLRMGKNGLMKVDVKVNEEGFNRSFRRPLLNCFPSRVLEMIGGTRRHPWPPLTLSFFENTTGGVD